MAADLAEAELKISKSSFHLSNSVSPSCAEIDGEIVCGRVSRMSGNGLRFGGRFLKDNRKAALPGMPAFGGTGFIPCFKRTEQFVAELAWQWGQCTGGLGLHRPGQECLVVVVPVDVPDPGTTLAGCYTKDVRKIARTDTSSDGELDRFQQTAFAPFFLEPRYWDFRMSLLDVTTTAACADQHVRELYPFSLQLGHSLFSNLKGPCVACDICLIALAPAALN
jgi:hypothetical protein